MLDRFSWFFAHNSLVYRPFFTRKVSNRSSQHALHIGQGAVSSVQLSVWSMLQSNLGQTWSTSIKLGQSRSNLSELWEMCSGALPRGSFEVVGPYRVRSSRSNPGQIWSNLGQTWSNSGKCALDLVLRSFWCGESSSDQVGLVWIASFCVSMSKKIPGVKMGLWQMVTSISSPSKAI